MTNGHPVIAIQRDGQQTSSGQKWEIQCAKEEGKRLEREEKAAAEAREVESELRGQAKAS